MTMNTLTERYIAATVKSLTPTAQDDVRAELEASITDAVEARVEQGEERTDAERAVLTQLGDPGILAAGYADRPLHLIGPKYYLTWWRLLKLLWAIVPAVAMGGVAIGAAIAGEDVGGIIGAMIPAGIGAFVHIGFWTTMIFAVLERTGSDAPMPEWDVDQLPELQTKSVVTGDLIATIVLAAVLAGSVIWDRFIGWGSDHVQVLSEGLWPVAATCLFLGLAATIVIALLALRAGRWTLPLAVANATIASIFLVGSLTLIWQNQMLDPDLTALWADFPDGVDTGVNVLLSLLFAGSLIASIPEPFVKAIRAARTMTGSRP